MTARSPAFPGIELPLLHPHDTSIALAFEMPKNVVIVDLAGCRLFATRIVSDLNIHDLIPRLVHIREQVPFCDLLMVEIVQDLARRARDRPADLERLRDTRQEDPRVICPVIERLEQRFDAVGDRDLSLRVRAFDGRRGVGHARKDLARQLGASRRNSSRHIGLRCQRAPPKPSSFICRART